MAPHEWAPYAAHSPAFGQLVLMPDWVRCRRCGAMVHPPSLDTPFKTMDDAVLASAVDPDCDAQLVRAIMER